MIGSESSFLSGGKSAWPDLCLLAINLAARLPHALPASWQQLLVSFAATGKQKGTEVISAASPGP